MESEKQLKDVRWVAKYLGVETLCVYRLVKEKKIPHIKIGFKIFFDEDIFKKFIEKGMEESLKNGEKNALV